MVAELKARRVSVVFVSAGYTEAEGEGRLCQFGEKIQSALTKCWLWND